MIAATTEIIARAVIRRDGQLLLARQRTKSWSFLPGGHVEAGERIEVALVREIAAVRKITWTSTGSPVGELADADMRPGTLKSALLAAGENRTPFWHPWNG